MGVPPRTPLITMVLPAEKVAVFPVGKVVLPEVMVAAEKFRVDPVTAVMVPDTLRVVPAGREFRLPAKTVSGARVLRPPVVPVMAMEREATSATTEVRMIFFIGRPK